MALKLVLWDWNGTLADDAEAALLSVNDMFERRAMPKIDMQLYRERVVTPIIGFYESFFDVESIGAGVIFKEFNEGYDLHFEKGRLHRGAKQALALLKNAGIKQAIVSSSEKTVLLKNTAALGVADYFDEILGSDDFLAGSKIERAKRYFEAQGLEPSEVLMVGDMDHDAQTAAEIGAGCLLIGRGHQSSKQLEAAVRDYPNTLLCPDILTAAAFALAKAENGGGLKLVTGGAGSGKTHCARSLAAGYCLAGLEPIVIVPEQFTFETEKAMLKTLGAPALSRMKIFSFTRLAEYVSRSQGEFAGKRLDDCARVAAMGLALLQLEPQLELYGGKKQSSVFINHLLDAVKEFKVCAITPEALAEAAQNAGGTLKKKLEELALVYAAYEAVVAQTAVDPLDDLTRLARQLIKSGALEGRPVIFDSFRSFTGQQLALMKIIISQAKETTVTLCCDKISESERRGLFAATVSTAFTLRAIAGELGIETEIVALETGGIRYKSAALKALEASMYRSEKSCFEGDGGDISIVRTGSKYDELEYCAGECRRLVREEKLRCRDIAIFAVSEGDYMEAAADAFAQQELPLYCDRRTQAASSAVMRFMLLSAELGAGGMDIQNVLRLLKTGLISGTDSDMISEFENYCFIWNITGADLGREFTLSPGGLDGRNEPEKLAGINRIRKRVHGLLSALRADYEQPSGESRAKALWRHIERAEAAKQLGEICETLGEDARSEQDQIWDIMISILDRCESIIGKTAISPRAFLRLLSMMADCCTVGHIPRGHDQISFGAAERMRVGSPKAVFVLGAIDGQLPAVPGSSGVFTDAERESLRQCGLPVAEPISERLYEERLLAYNALCAASERLYLCCPLGSGGDEKNNAVQSECVGEILSIVPFARVISDGGEKGLDCVEAKPAALELYARYLSEGSENAPALAAALSRCEGYSGKTEELKSAAAGAAPKLRADCAARLYENGLSLSASGIESYFGCPFRFFCSSGLRAYQRRRVRLGYAEFGTVTHYVLERFFSENRNSDFSRLMDDKAGISKRCSELIEDYLNDKAGGAQGKSARFLSALRSMREGICSLIVNICAELSQTEFRPAAFELRIGENEPVKPRPLEARGGVQVSLRGMIDRVDLLESSDKYARIIDYKTNSREFKLCNVLEGADMQMLIYLDELCSSDFEGGCKPAGLLYFPAYSGTISDKDTGNTRSIDGEELEARRGADLLRSGMLIDDETLDLAEAMEPGLCGKYLPVKYDSRKKAAAALSAKSGESLISPASFDIVRRYVRWKIARMSSEAASGRIECDPLAISSSPCDYCDYRDICRYEGSERTPKSQSVRESIMQMASEMNEESGESDNG